MTHDRRKEAASDRALATRAQRGLGPQPPIVGRLQRHGAAPYQFREGEEISYYVDLIVVGKQKRIWGKDLRRALEQAETKPKLGEVVGVQLVSQHAFTITHRARDETGRIVAQTDREAHRNEWKIEKVQYFSDRARAARLARDEQQDRAKALTDRPELKSTFLSLRAAQALAEQKLSNPADRDRFLKFLREAIDRSTVNNEPLPTPRLREPDTRESSPKRSRKRDDPSR